MYTKLIRIHGHAILCTLAALLVLLIIQPASAQMFYADFEDGSGVNDPAQWVADNTGQNWGIADFPGTGKGLKNLNEGCGTSGNTPLPGVDNFKDGTIQLDMSWEDDDSWGVILRKTADDAGYLVVFGYIETPSVIVADLAKGCATTGNCLDQVQCENNPANTLIEVPHGLGANLTQNLSVSYTGRIEAKGDRIRVWFLPTAGITDPLGDLGDPLVEIQDSAHTGPGSVGIWQESQGGSMIDNVIVLAGVGGQPFAWRPNPKDGALLENTWGTLMWSPGDFAVSHDVYLSDNFDDVNSGAQAAFVGNQATTDLIIGFPGYPVPGGLVPGTTYYWRIDEVNDANAASPWKGEIWSFSIPPKTAYNPAPADGAKFIGLQPTLTWTGGFGAKLHTVYFGDSFDGVSSATGGAFAAKAEFTPAGPLEAGKVYYWRVDEFDPPFTHKGEVWSFATVPDIAITDASLMGWWKLDEGMGSTAVDWSGQGRHGSLVGDPEWVAGYDGGALEFDGSNHVDTGYTENLATWTIACWVKSPAAPSGASPSGPLHREQNYQFNWNHGNDVFRGAAAMNVGGTWHAASYMPLSANRWYHLAATYDGNAFNAYRDGVLITSNTAPSGAANAETNTLKLGRHAAAAQFFTGTVDDARVYNKALTQDEIQQVMKGDTSVARHPNPAAGSTPNITEATPLTWTPGDKAAQHDVYFGTDQAAVADADASDTTGVYRGRQSAVAFTPAEGVEWGGGPYYWRVDEYNTDSTIGTGWVWSFTVADYLTVDDFESYNDIEPPDAASNRIFDNWIDGFGTTTNGALVGNDLPPYAEQSIVHSGGQSMIYRYDNAGKTSEATLTLVSQRDWTAEGVTKLSLWLRGDSANSANRIYVALNGSAVVYHDDPAATQLGGWREWVIDLATFGVSLTNVNSISIGVGTRGAPAPGGGTGTLYFDDIRLFR